MNLQIQLQRMTVCGQSLNYLMQSLGHDNMHIKTGGVNLARMSLVKAIFIKATLHNLEISQIQLGKVFQ